jgi:adenine-specific DNA-methyltransferase
MNKLKLHTPDLTAANVERIAALFPNCVTEAADGKGSIRRAIDFDLLKQELSADLVEGPQERYRLDWPGKRESLALANTPVAQTLRPCREESVDFENTQNLYIEGDNLDALKLLQDTYLGKVKMIYIDPPYNTGNDFIYEDDFTAEKEAYQRGAGVMDEEGNRMMDEERWRQNTTSNGRFHSDWLSMIYSRLKLARSLLSDDGVICISVDDNEQANARRLCDEVFGSSNFEGHIHWRRRHNQPNDPTKMIGLVAEHVIVYAKNKEALKSAGVGKIALTGDFSNPDNDPRGPWASKPWKVGSDQSGSRYIIVRLIAKNNCRNFVQKTGTTV